MPIRHSAGFSVRVTSQRSNLRANRADGRILSEPLDGSTRGISTSSPGYAEVKAITAGNPVVLADAELQQLAVLRRNHADEQYIARRRLKELPQQIERLEQRRDALTADQRTIAGSDSGAIVVGGKSVSFRDAPIALTPILERLPEVADRRFPLG
jgi:hypothetical protein